MRKCWPGLSVKAGSSVRRFDELPKLDVDVAPVYWTELPPSATGLVPRLYSSM